MSYFILNLPVNIVEFVDQVQRVVGYCPQFDALLEKQTVKETLSFYARLKGIPEQYIQNRIHDVIKLVSLKHNTDAMVENLRYVPFSFLLVRNTIM